MLVDITPNEAYSLVKNSDVARGWPQYAIEKLFKYLSDNSTNNCIDIIGALINWNHYDSLKEIKENYKDWEQVVDKSVSFEAWAETNDPEANTNGYKTEYLVPYEWILSHA
jgi:hypothetical protein